MGGVVGSSLKPRVEDQVLAFVTCPVSLERPGAEVIGTKVEGRNTAHRYTSRTRMRCF